MAKTKTPKKATKSERSSEVSRTLKPSKAKGTSKATTPGSTKKKDKSLKNQGEAKKVVSSKEDGKGTRGVSGHITFPGGYSAIAYKLGPLGSVRYIMIRPHSAKKGSDNDDEAHPKGKTLFVLNPPIGSPESLTSLFTKFGKVKNVEMTSIPAGTGNGAATPAAYVVFKSAAVMSKALEVNCEDVIEVSPLSEEQFGLKKWERDYDSDLPDVHELQAKIDTNMRSFDDKVAKEKALKLSMHGQEDDEGWTMVTKGAKVETPAEKAGFGSKNVSKKDKKDRELQNFYRFQIKEARKEQIALLRQKFDQDKLKIKRLQENRKFRPY